MARKPKHPGLQKKFEALLRSVLAGSEGLKAREIAEAARARASEFQMTSAEVEDLARNFANYASRAKDSEVIVSAGPWGGYSLHESKVARTVSPTQAAEFDGGPVAGVGEAKQRRHWESLLHLPLTIALSQHFSSRVLSLPNATDNVRWGNPDMLMLRPSLLSKLQEFDATLDPDNFALVDATPQAILASLEVKAKLDRDRAQLFTAIAEAAANSRWANEAWLVFVDWTPLDDGLDEDVVSLARSVEVGLLEVQVPSAENTLRTIVHYAAPTRTGLRIGELTSERVGVLQSAQQLIETWVEEEATFLEVDGGENKARVLLGHALENLARQKGFGQDCDVKKALGPFRTTETDRLRVNRMLKASLSTLAMASGLETDSDIVEQVRRAADETLTKRQAEAMGFWLEQFASCL